MHLNSLYQLIINQKMQWVTSGAPGIDSVMSADVGGRGGG